MSKSLRDTLLSKVIENSDYKAIVVDANTSKTSLELQIEQGKVRLPPLEYSEIFKEDLGYSVSQRG